MSRSSPDTLETPWAQSAQAVLDALKVNPESGLDSQAVARRRRRYGANRLRQIKGRSAWAILLAQVKNLIIVLLAVAAVVSFAFGQHLEAAAVLVAILLNVTIGFFTELRATRSMEALQRLGGVEARVRREETIRSVEAGKLVPGDIVLLESGDVVAADLRLLEASRLSVDESALTGESVPVSKQSEPVEAQSDLAERRSMVFKGTAVTRGSGWGVVSAVGMETELGRIAALAEASEAEETPLEKRLQRLGHRLIWLTLAIAGLVILAGILAGKELLLIIETAIALAVAAAPEGLPMVATIALARGMWRLLKRNALMNRLSAVETLGSTTTIFTDKTGTLTENRMTVTRIVTAGGGRGEMEEVNLQPDADAVFKGPQGAVDPDKNPVLKEVLETGMLCNNASLDDESSREGEISGVGDPLEIALLRAGRLAGLERKALLESYPEAREEAFDHALKMMATVHKEEKNGGAWRIAVKGAPEAVLDASIRLAGSNGNGELDDQTRKRWLEQNEQLAAEGLRVLALAAKRTDSQDAEPYEALSFLGLIGMQDPPRGEVPGAIQACSEAGIEVVMVTG
ncbi:MAG: HAD-IC family P-type ATPase, partial [Desulfobacterales bacterium]